MEKIYVILLNYLNAWEEYDLQDYKYIFDKEHWLEPTGLYAWNRPDQQWWFEGDNGEKWIELHPSPEQHLNYCVDNQAPN